MVLKHGASDYYEFAVNKGATLLRTGDVPTTGRLTEPSMAINPINNTNALTDIVRNNGFNLNTKATDPLLWQYEEGALGPPQLWVYRDSSDNVVSVWESESGFYKDATTNTSPFVANAENGAEVFDSNSGYSSHEILFIGEDDIDTIMTTVDAASLPSWITGTRYAWITTTATLIDQLCRQWFQNAGLAYHDDIETALKRTNIAWVADIYVLIFLRQASKIIYNYNAETCIELIRNRFTVDSTGAITVT